MDFLGTLEPVDLERLHDDPVNHAQGRDDADVCHEELLGGFQVSLPSSSGILTILVGIVNYKNESALRRWCPGGRVGVRGAAELLVRNDVRAWRVQRLVHALFRSEAAE